MLSSKVLLHQFGNQHDNRSFGKKEVHPTFLNCFKGPSLLDAAVDTCKNIGSSLKTVELNELAMDTTGSYYAGYWTGSRRYNK